MQGRRVKFTFFLLFITGTAMSAADSPQLFRTETSVTLAMPRDAAWEKMRDLTASVNYVPGLIACDITTEQTEGVGASRRVKNSFLEMDETVVEWNEGRGFTIRLHDGDNKPPMFAEAYFIYAITDGETPDTTQLTTAMAYRLPWGAVGKLLNAMLIRFIVAGQVRDVAVSMKYNYETGNKTPAAELKRLKRELAL